MFLRFVLAWLVGTVAAHLLAPSLLALGSAIGGLLLLGLLGRDAPRMRHGAILGLALVLGALRYSAGLPNFGPSHIVTLADQGELVVAGVVAEAPRQNATSQRLILTVEAVQTAAGNQAAEGRVLVVLPSYPAYSYGQRLRVRGALSQPRAAEREGEFDYRAYLAHRNIFVIMAEPSETRLLTGSSGNPALAALLRLREYCRSILLRTLPEPQAALAVGIMLGIRSTIPEAVANAFAATGTSHILVISGWHFSLVAGVLAGLATSLRLKGIQALVLTLGVMWGYALFAGASAAVLRAATMASLATIGKASKRERDPWRLLGASCWFLCLANPHTLWDLGFQLSALAIVSLFAFSSPIDTWLAARRPFTWPGMAPVRASLTATLAVQVLTLPLIAYHFGNLSLIAPLANILIVPLLPFVMAASALTLLGGVMWLPLGQLIAPCAWLPLTAMSAGVMLLASPRWAALQVPPFPLWLLLSYYGLVAVAVWWSGRSVER
ncbi:MAG: ComEC family competence protein [Candidatus Viridilinea halotolerans]|uniref:ComEC family competence protein n=1 Tax=Candidatus Viridilinea halotolerans TaxID=2491704 RepID=A0A426TT41_9CHLR|nr:MAG: ComEC family competence protein [Candidatus Viridilinea halotolerans]